MKFTCNTNTLNKSIQTVQRAILSKPSTPIFSGIHFFCNSKGHLELHAMDINMAIACEMEATIMEEGEILVSAKHISELVRKLNAETVTISTNDETKTIKVISGKSEFQLLTMPVDEYPKFPTFDPNQSITLSDDYIKELIKKTIFACSQDDARPLFTGILVEVKDDNITFVGTNTHRLAIKTLPQPATPDMSIIIPSKVLGEIMRNLTSDEPQNVTISLLNNQMMVIIDNTTIVSRLIEGKFPDYRRVVPPQFAITAKVNVREMTGAVERVALFSVDGDNSTIKMHVEGNEIKITSSSPEVGTGLEIISSETVGDSLNIAFNSKYILDILKNLESEEAILQMNTSLSPVCITSDDEPDYKYIVTPVRVVF